MQMYRVACVSHTVTEAEEPWPAGYTLKRKFKGHQNRTTQIRASMGVPADFLICGSDDGWVYVWDIAGSDKIKDAASKQVRRG